MIRKQIYIEAGQRLALARAARLQGTSEAAVIRNRFAAGFSLASWLA